MTGMQEKPLYVALKYSRRGRRLPINVVFRVSAGHVWLTHGTVVEYIGEWPSNVIIGKSANLYHCNVGSRMLIDGDNLDAFPIYSERKMNF